MDFATLQGKTLTTARQIGDDRMEFVDNEGNTYAMFHSQDCCESVVVESITGDLADLIGTPILLAEEASSSDDPADVTMAKASKRAADPDAYVYDDESQTWTFYKLRTIKGSVDIRWHGSSNGYYSEGVDFVKTN